MKQLLMPLVLLSMSLFAPAVYAQEQPEKLDLPGDNLNLYAVMKLFQESKTLEGFERKLNSDSSHINNLDLNGDDKIDYIKVKDNVEGYAHTIVLQVDLNAKEKQDVAVFTVQKDDNNKTQIQLIGDEALYGKNYIIEPNMEDGDNSVAETPNPGYSGNSRVINGQEIPVTTTSTTVISNWPIIEYVYTPAYAPWESPWNYGYYPSYWRPWQPVYWHQYWGYQHNWDPYYYGHYRRWDRYRYSRYNEFYYSGFRSRSAYYDQRVQSGYYRATYSRPDSRYQGEAAFRASHPGNTGRVNSPAPVRQPKNEMGQVNPSIPRTVKAVPERTSPTRSIPVKDTRPVRPLIRTNEQIGSAGSDTRPVKPVIRATEPVRQGSEVHPVRPNRLPPVIRQSPVRQPTQSRPAGNRKAKSL